MTTGHEWDGLQELNRPLPKWWLYVLWTCVAVAVVLCILYPSVPGITGYWHGLLGYSQRASVDQAVADVAAQRAGAMDRIKVLSFAEIRKDPQLLAKSRKPPAASPSPTTASPATAPAAAATPASRHSPPATGSGAARWRTSSRP